MIRPRPPELPPLAYPKERFYRQPLLHFIFPTCRTPPNTQLALYANDTAILAQSWRTDTIVHQIIHATSVLLHYFTRWKFQVNIHKTEAIFITRCHPVPTAPLHFQHTVIPWKSQVRYLSLLFDPKLLFKRHLTSVTQKATRIFLHLYPLFARDSTLFIPNKITLYKLFIRSVLTYAAPVWSNTSSSNYRRLQILQSKCLRVIGKYPRRTPIPHLHTALNVAPIRDFIYHSTDNFFGSGPAHPNPLIRFIRNYTLADSIASIRNTYTNGPSTFFYSHSPNCCSVFPLVLVYHCYTYTYLAR
jgi:hypothetical protein